MHNGTRVGESSHSIVRVTPLRRYPLHTPWFDARTMLDPRSC